MPRPWQTLERELGGYLGELRDAGRSEENTIRPYEWALRRQLQGLIDFGYNWHPRKITREDIEFLRDEFITGTNRYKENQVKIMLGFLRWAGNKGISKMHISFGDTSPTRVRWLEDDQAQMVRNEAVGIEKMIVHCELDLGMRRQSLIRLTVGSFHRGHRNHIHIHGKGRNGGKHWNISWDPDTPATLHEYLHNARQLEIEKARAKNPSCKIPEALFIYERAGKLYPYKKTAFDDFLAALGKRVGFHFSNHDLRRTCGRQMYRAGVGIEEIAKIFGHADTRTTLEYIGLDLVDLDGAMQKYAQYRKNNFEPKTVQNELIQKESGQSGISAHQNYWLEPVLNGPRFTAPDRELLKK